MNETFVLFDKDEGNAMKRQVHIHSGVVQGLAATDPAITVFRGVPFAQPPVGELRWRAPQPVTPWKGILETFDFAPTAMQPTPGNSNEFYDKEWGTDPSVDMSEDCLYANVWTPALRGNKESTHTVGEKKPVMVWIYGGAYQTGGTFEKEFDGEALARHDVIVVSIAYRLNVFGFFAHPQLGDAANFGFLDQQAGIRWVKENIEAFGGDPNNITVFGQSAGAASVLAQICSPGNTGLFQHAIMQSGGGLGYFNAHLASLEEIQANGVRLFDALGVTTLEEARAVPARHLLEAAENLPVPPESGHEGEWPMLVNWQPCIDGAFLDRQERDIIRSHDAADVDVIIGNTTGEFLETADDGTVIPAGQLGNFEFIDEWIDAKYRAPYYYHFDISMPGDDAGAFHSSDLWFVFSTLGKCWRPFEGWHYDVAHAMTSFWASFAHDGNPEGETLPEWKHTTKRHEFMNFARRVSMSADLSRKKEEEE